MKRRIEFLAIVICVSLAATAAAQAGPLINGVVVSYPVDAAHPTLTISGTGFGQNPLVLLGTARLKLLSNTAAQLVAAVSGVGIPPGTYRLQVRFSNVAAAAFIVPIDAATTIDLSALEQQVATLQQQATASQQQIATLQAQAAASQQQVAGLQAAVIQLQAAVTTIPATLPANLTALSNALSTNNGVSLSGAAVDTSSACNSLNIGDTYLSVNGYGQGALPADGRLVSIVTYNELFAVIGINFGGDGRTTFGLPDLRAFAPQGLEYSICTSGPFPTHF